MSIEMDLNQPVVGILIAAVLTGQSLSLVQSLSSHRLPCLDSTQRSKSRDVLQHVCKQPAFNSTNTVLKGR